MAPQNMDKVVLSVVATVVVVVAWALILAGSFVPKWARPLNNTQANTTYSLWGREDCYDVICKTKYTKYHSNIHTWWIDDQGKNRTKTTFKVNVVPTTTCVVANYCNVTWFKDMEFNEIPSLLLIARAFVLPSLAAGFITAIIYILKIVMMVLRPSWRRIHIKAAYLTFAAVAGFCAGIAVIIFVAMLDEEVFELLWAPALPGVGGFLLILIAVGGYLGWRNHSTDEEFDDQSEFSDRTSNIYEFSSSGKSKGGVPSGSGLCPGSGTGPGPGAVTGKKYNRSTSNQSSKSEEV